MWNPMQLHKNLYDRLQSLLFLILEGIDKKNLKINNSVPREWLGTKNEVIKTITRWWQSFSLGYL